MFIQRKILITSATIITMLSSTMMAMASPAKSTVSLNIRTGPATTYGVVDRLHANEVVDITECNTNAWCYITHDGPDGWVSSRYLTAISTTPPAGVLGQNCKMVFKIDATGPSFKLECDDAGPILGDPTPIPTPTPPTPARATACLYTGINFTGAEYCDGVSTHRNLDGFDNIFASVKLHRGAKIKLCSGTSFSGNCKTYTSSRARLHNSVYKRASSMKVFTGPVVTISNKACLYSGNNYTGSRYCTTTRRLNNLPSSLKRKVSSIRLYGSAKVKICTSANLNGFCQLITRQSPRLSSVINNKAMSLAVYTGTPPRAAVSVRISRNILLNSGRGVDLDSGSSTRGLDIILVRNLLGISHLENSNGAKFYIAGNRSPSLARCKSARYNRTTVRRSNLSVGTYICVKTSQGRYSKLHINSRGRNVLGLRYTTYN